MESGIFMEGLIWAVDIAFFFFKWEIYPSDGREESSTQSSQFSISIYRRRHENLKRLSGR